MDPIGELSKEEAEAFRKLVKLCQTFSEDFS
jgi:hypothetical protein